MNKAEPQETAALLQSVLNTINERGWVRCRMEAPDGSVCLVGAINRSGFWYDDRVRVMRALCIELGFSSYASESPLMNFNDNQRWSWPVKRLIRRTIKAERKRAAAAETPSDPRDKDVPNNPRPSTPPRPTEPQSWGTPEFLLAPYEPPVPASEQPVGSKA